MRVHTNDFKEELKVFGRQIKGKIIYYPSYELITENGNNILTESDLQIISEQANYESATEIDEEDIFSISIIKNGNLLQSLMKEFDFETKEELNIGSIVNPQFGLLVTGDYEYLNYGNYIINSKEFNMDTETWSYVCYDKMLFSMVKYRGLSNIEYPITIKQFINKLCDKIGLEFEDSEFVNQEQLIYEDLYKNRNVTYRDIFDEISKIVAGNLLINDNDKLDVGYVNKAIGESEEKSGSSLEITDGQNAELINFELEGKTEQENTPTPDNPSDLVSVGYENLFVGADTAYVNGITFIKNSDGSYNIGGTATAQANIYNFVDITESNIKNGKYYTFYVDQQLPEGVEILAEVFNGSTWVRHVTNVLTNTRQTITKIVNLTSGTRIRYGLRVRSGYSVNIVDLKITFIKGTIQKQYIPYGKYGIEIKTTNEENENTYLYTLDQPLRNIGNTKDLLYIKNGKLYVDRKIGSVVLNGSENWQVSATNVFRINGVYPTDVALRTEAPFAYSNYYKYAYYDANITARIQDGEISWNGSKYLVLRNNNISSIESLKSWLSAHNTEVQYILAESYTEEVGQVDMPSTYKGITHIDTTDELEPNMDITYVKEFEAINEEYLKDTNVRMSEKIGVINSVAILDTDNNLEYIQEDTESIKTNEMTRITITNNLLALNGDTNTIALNILNKLNGLYYYANDLQTTGVCYYDFLDMFNVEARGNIYQCLLLNNEITITQGIEEHIFTEKLEEAQTSSNEYTTSVMTNKQIQFNINQQEGRIESKVEKDGVISAINQSAEEIQINADKLSFEGATIDMTADNVKIKGENLRIEGDEIEITDDGTATNPNFSINYEDNSNEYWIKSFISSASIWFRGKDNRYTQPGYLGDFRMTLPGSSSFVPGIKMYWSQTENDIYPNYPDESEYLNLRYTEIYPQFITLYYNNKTTTITASGITTPTLTQTSKAESKKNFEKLTNAKDILYQVDIYKYNFKDEDDNVKKSIGFVIGDDFNYSQEITSENNDGANIYSMVSVLWQAVKEQQKEIEELKEMIKNGKY